MFETNLAPNKQQTRRGQSKGAFNFDNNDENMIDKNYSSFTKTGPNKGNYKLDEPENHREERKEGKGARAREKRTSNSL